MIDKNNEILLKKLVEIQAGKRVIILYLIFLMSRARYQRVSHKMRLLKPAPRVCT